MKEETIKQILWETEERRVPADLDHWPAIRERIKQRRSRLPRVLPVTQVGWVLLVVIVLLALGAGTYAVGTLMKQATNMEAGLQYIEQAKLYQKVNQSQTIGGITVTLENVYADANRVVIGTTVKGPSYLPDQREIIHGGNLELTDDKGHVLSEIGSVGQGSQPDPKGRERAVSYLASFDTSAVPGEPQRLHLHLVVNVNTSIVPTPAACPVGKDCGGPAEPPIAKVGPFTFDFTVPVIPGRVVKVGQTVEKSGAALTLDRVIITPSQTRAIVCFPPPDQEYDRWIPSGELDPGVVRGSWVGRFIGFNYGPSKDCYTYDEFAYYGDRHGEWTLTVNELRGVVDWQPEKEKWLKGPWVFRFRVP